VRRTPFDPLEVPNYGFEDAVRYLHVPHSTLQYWLRPSINLLKPAHPTRNNFSFKNLVECYVLEGLRAIHGVRLSRIRKAVEYMQENYQSRHPLADYDLKTDGRHIYFSDQTGKTLTDVSMRGQLGLAPVLDAYLKRIERNFGKGRWVLYPFTRAEHMKSKEDKPRVVSISPDVCFGLPVLIGTRITTSVLVSRRLGGDSDEVLARAYGRSPSEIAEAISWEIGKIAQAA
jgi:uncharacterized protein (DUF433 family)